MRLRQSLPCAAACAILLSWTAGHAAQEKTPRAKATDLDSFGYPTNLVKAYALGRAQAQRELTNGVLAIKTSGLPAPWDTAAERMLRERYGVRSEPIAGCLVSAGLMEFQRGYNEVTAAVITNRFGADVFERVVRESQAEFPPQAPTDSGPPTATGAREYRVRSGDTLLLIARTHGVTVKALADSNPGLEPRMLRVGQKLIVPNPSRQARPPK